MFRILNALFPKKYRNNKGIFDFGVGGGYKKQKQETARPEFIKSPEYEEAKGARQSWWQRLQDWGASPSYGAVSPSWEDVWQKGAQKVRDYYWGTASSPGLIGKVKGSAARRGVSDQPALGKEITKMAVSEGRDIADMTTQQNIAQAQLGEQARMNWLKSLMGLSQLSPRGTWYTPWSQTSGFDVSGDYMIGK